MDAAERNNDEARYYEPLDPEYMTDLVRKFFGPLARHYFRPRILGLQKLPARGPAILAANHSGKATPNAG